VPEKREAVEAIVMRMTRPLTWTISICKHIFILFHLNHIPIFSENRDDQDYDENGSTANALNRSRRGYSNAKVGEGKANRISAYRKSQVVTNKAGSRDEPDAREYS